MTQPSIQAPAGFVPQMAVTFANSDASAIRVDADNPLPTGERAFQGAIPIVPGTDQAPCRGIAINCTTAGTIQLKLADDSLFVVPVQAGLSILPFAVKTVVAAGTTAVATCSNLA